MSLHRIDPRFVLPRPIRTALVLGQLEEWVRGLEVAGVDVVTSGRRSADLVVAPSKLAREAAERASEFLLIEGDAKRDVRRRGYTAQTLILRPSRERPTLLLATEHRQASGYAAEHWSITDTKWKATRVRAARLLLSRGWLPSSAATVVTAGARSPEPPYFVAAAAELGVPADSSWALTLGQGDALSRNAFHLFAGSSDSPSFVVKFARVPGYSDPFDRDERGLEIAEAGGAVTSGRAPRLFGRFEVDGTHASVESAAVGRRLYDVLLDAGDPRATLRTIDAITTWLIDFQQQTAAPAAALEAERARLQHEILDRRDAAGALAAAFVDGVPAVAQHNDLGSWNVIVRDEAFTIVDWESARRFALPLWDLLYFLADTLVAIDGRIAAAEHAAATIELFAGERRTSDVLFSAVRRAVTTLAIPADSVGPLAALCWLHHARSGATRDAALRQHAEGERPTSHAAEHVADLWMQHPALGWTWRAWRN